MNIFKLEYEELDKILEDTLPKELTKIIYDYYDDSCPDCGLTLSLCNNCDDLFCCNYRCYLCDCCCFICSIYRDDGYFYLADGFSHLTHFCEDCVPYPYLRCSNCELGMFCFNCYREFRI